MKRKGGEKVGWGFRITLMPTDRVMQGGVQTSKVLDDLNNNVLKREHGKIYSRKKPATLLQTGSENSRTTPNFKQILTGRSS